MQIGADPFHDAEFIHALMETYTIAPTTDWIDRVVAEGAPA